MTIHFDVGKIIFYREPLNLPSEAASATIAPNIGKVLRVHFTTVCPRRVDFP